MISNKIYQKILTLNSKEFSTFPIFLNSNFKRKFKIFDRIRLIKLINEEVWASLEAPKTRYPFSNKNLARYEPSCPETPHIKAFFTYLVYKCTFSAE